MYAVIAEGGGQRLVQKDDILLIDLIDGGQGGKAGKTITFDKVLCIGSGDGSTAAKVGAPYVAGASVTAEVLEDEVKGDKLFIIKFRRRKRYSRRTGHRQAYTRVKITGIDG